MKHWQRSAAFPELRHWFTASQYYRIRDETQCKHPFGKQGIQLCEQTQLQNGTARRQVLPHAALLHRVVRTEDLQVVIEYGDGELIHAALAVQNAHRNNRHCEQLLVTHHLVFPQQLAITPCDLSHSLSLVQHAPDSVIYRAVVKALALLQPLPLNTVHLLSLQQRQILLR